MLLPVDSKRLALCFTRLLYVWNTLVGPGQHPRYTRAPAGGGRGWANMSRTAPGTGSSSSLRTEVCNATANMQGRADHCALRSVMPYVRNSYLQKNSVCNRARIAASGPQIPFLVGNDDELHK